MKLKVLVLFLLVGVMTFAAELVDGKYTMIEKVFMGKKWRSKVELVVKNHEMVTIDYDMIDKNGNRLTKSNELDKYLGDNKENPFEVLPKQYFIKSNTNKGVKGIEIDTIAGASSATHKFNKMMKKLVKKAEKGETGEFHEWFN